MANVLGELFQKIADAIREQTGETGTMKPADFPGAILGIEAGSDITLIDNIDITPDFSHGNQFVVAQEGYAVKGATILKPETLIPENIAAGIDIAGIIGTHIGGGGGGSAEGCVTVTFMNGDVELFKRPVYIGDDCPEPVAQGRFDAPTKESTDQCDYTFYGWGASDGGAADANILKNIRADKTVYAIFAEGGQLNAVTTWTLDPSDYTLHISSTGGTPHYTETKRPPWWDKKDKIKACVLEEGMTLIGNYVLDGCTNLKTVSLPSTLTTIGTAAFSNTALQSVIIPSSVNMIYKQAFLNSNLTSATFKTTTGWYVYTSIIASATAALTSGNMSNTSVAARYLTSTYVDYLFIRS